MNSTEQQLLSLLDMLSGHPDPDAVAVAGLELAVLADAADDLDSADPPQRAVRELYEYAEAAVRAAEVERSSQQLAERADIEGALSAALAASRRGGSVWGLNCVRDDLDRIARRIDEANPVAADALRHLWSYVEMKNRQALGDAVRCEWGDARAIRPFEADPAGRVSAYPERSYGSGNGCGSPQRPAGDPPGSAEGRSVVGPTDRE